MTSSTPSKLKSSRPASPDAPGAMPPETHDQVVVLRPRPTLVAALILAAYMYSLEMMVTSQFLSYATSGVGHHSQLGTLASASAVVLAVSKPLAASLATTAGRGSALFLVAAGYGVGLGLTSVARGMGVLFVGQMFYAAASSALQIILQVVVADLTSLRRRGLGNGALAAPFLVNIVVAGEVVQRVLPNWRAGYAVFAILAPASLVPLALLLSADEARSRRSHNTPTSGATTPATLDFTGLALLTAMLSCFVVGNTPMTLLGALLIPALAYHSYNTPQPVLPIRLLRGPVLAAAIVAVLDFTSFYLCWTYLYPFIAVTTAWSPRAISYYLYSNSLALTAASLASGGILYATRRVKWPMLLGLLIRLSGLLLTLPARLRVPPSPSLLLLAQLIPGLGGGLANVASLSSAHAASAPSQIPAVSALLLLAAEVGNVAGASGAKALWTGYLPSELERHVPGGEELRRALAGSFERILEYEQGDPVRVGAGEAYRAVMRRMVLWGVAVACVPPVVCWFLTEDVRLEDEVVFGAGSGVSAAEAGVAPGALDLGADGEGYAELRLGGRAGACASGSGERTPLLSDDDEEREYPGKLRHHQATRH